MCFGGPKVVQVPAPPPPEPEPAPAPRYVPPPPPPEPEPQALPPTQVRRQYTGNSDQKMRSARSYYVNKRRQQSGSQGQRPPLGG